MRWFGQGFWSSVLGSTVYSFSLMLANFLFGITVGGLLVVPFFKRKIDFRLLLTFFQFGIGLYVVFSLYQSNWILSSFIRPFCSMILLQIFGSICVMLPP